MRQTNWNVLLLAVCQALLATGNAVVITTSALVGQILGPEGLATLPLFLQFVAVMAIALPASFLMKRIGRRPGFAVGACFAIGAGLMGWVAILIGSFWLFCLASAGYGVFMGFGMYYRFAAADVAEPAFRPRAISYVLAGGVVAAIAGPELAKATAELFAPALFAGCFAAIAVLGAATVLVLSFVTIPPPGEEERSGRGRPLSAIVRQPAFLVALGGAALAQGAMVLVMTATPLAMALCGHAFNDTAFVIQWHVLGMFAPSFFTGHLIGRFGTLNIMVAGAGLMLACLGVALSGVEIVQFWAALVLLGVGWNFMFIGGTTLLTTTYSPPEKAKVQALNDLLTFATAALASLCSGILHHLIGWQAVSLSMILPLLAMMAAIFWLKRHDPGTSMGPATS
ncbi:MAG: MFS transporter [Geminicoccaceae bacterium]